VLLLFCVYFVLFEIQVVLIKGRRYFSSSWKYLEITPVILIIILCISSLSDFNSKKNVNFVRLQAIAALSMWLKFLYYLRIWKATGYLVRMITEVVAEMKTFLFVLLVIVIAYADAFYSLA